jgi:type IV pilus assembly protein PilA
MKLTLRRTYSKKGQRRSKGFTLLELLIVVIIIGILATVALPQFIGFVEKARASEAVGMVGAIRTALYAEALGIPPAVSIAAAGNAAAILTRYGVDVADARFFTFGVNAVTVDSFGEPTAFVITASRIGTGQTITLTRAGGAAETWGGTYPYGPNWSVSYNIELGENNGLKPTKDRYNCCSYLGTSNSHCLLIVWYQEKNKMRSSVGFTLIELLIIIVILGVLSAVAVPGYDGIMSRQRLRQAESNLKAIRSAERFYFLGEKHYTGNTADLHLDTPSLLNGPYGYVFTGGVPPTGAQAQDGGTPVKSINFDTGVITSP